eukprot:scaffold65173_cov63-Cyclotella_meneghiniana.AAC.2
MLSLDTRHADSDCDSSLLQPLYHYLPNDEPVEKTNHNDDADSALNNDEGCTNNCESSTTNNQTDANKEEDPTMMEELMGAHRTPPSAI